MKTLRLFRQVSSLRRWALLSLSLLVLGAVWLPEPEATAAEAKKSWSGTWNNKKYNTTGELTCTVLGTQNGQWIASFTGTGLGKPFKYTALMTPKQSGTNIVLTGNTKVDGDAYAWSGVIKGAEMTGSFRSGTGNNGQFVLKAK